MLKDFTIPVSNGVDQDYIENAILFPHRSEQSFALSLQWNT
jgi:hypothetical protein